MRPVRHSLLALAVLLSAACSSDSPSEPAVPNIDGTWVGSQGGVATNVTLTGGTGGPVTGSGTISGGGSNFPITVTGTYSHPSVVLTIQAQGFPNLGFEGQFSDANTITGVLSGSGLNNLPYTLQRQSGT
jgi:hypothetical protein